MKKLSALLIMFSALQSFAQGTSGKITYTETTKFNFSLEGEASEFAKAFPKEAKSEKELYFSPIASSWQSSKSKADKNVDDMSEGIEIRINVNDDKVYNDLKTNQRIEQREFMSRIFLVTSDIKKQDWKITGGQKQILGYPCVEAKTTKDSTEITA